MNRDGEPIWLPAMKTRAVQRNFKRRFFRRKRLKSTVTFARFQFITIIKIRQKTVPARQTAVFFVIYSKN
ncbi:MAG: hypothetical protein LBP79_03495 [Clostridiales bacterium]|nr:hypothetical protein [Clostridiales bacterium]